MKNGIAMPSFTNSHVHIVDSVCKDIDLYKPIDMIVGKGGVKFKCLENKLREEKEKAVKDAMEEMLKNATLFFCDFREEEKSGIEFLANILKSYKLIEYKILGRSKDSKEIDSILEISDGIGIPDMEYMNINDLKRIRVKCKKKNKLFAIHCSETKREVKNCLKLKPDFVVHLTNIDDYDLYLIKKYKIPVVICPRANSSLAVGVPRVKELLEATLVGIGTDNVMINNLNMFREIEYTFKITRAIYRDYKFNAKTILKVATINGRKILKAKTNEIVEGNVADFVIFRNKPFLHDEYLAIVHRYSSEDIKVVVKENEVMFR